MPARVVLHADKLDPFLLGIKSALGKRGVAVVQEDSFAAEDVHIVTSSDLSGPNVIQVASLLVAPYRALIHPALQRPFKIDAVPYPQAKALFEELRADHATGKRYAAADLPEGILAVVIAEDDDEIAVHRMISDALATKRFVVLVAEDPMKSGNLAQFANHFPSVLIYHDLLADLLHKVDAVISWAGAGVILAHIHRTPAVLYNATPFDHISPVVSTEVPFETALAKALATEGVYAKYLHWYFQTQAFRTDAPDFADRLLDAFRAIGFGPGQLGLEITSGFARTLADTHTAAQSLTAFLEQQPEIKEVKLTKTLKVSDQSWVFQAQINGKTVVVKRFHDADPAHTVRSLQGELTYMYQAMGAGAFTVNQCLFAWPEAGTVVLSYAGGVRMVDAIAARSGEQRLALLMMAGDWLNAYATPRHRMTSFGPLYWIKELEARPRHKLTPDNAAVFDTAVAKLSRFARQVMGKPVIQAATHGDYAGINVHFDKQQVIGVDIQGECWQALAKDAVHFLVWQALHDPKSTGPRILGINGADYEAYFAGLPMLDAEHTTIIPFFIGRKILHHMLDKADRDHDVAGVLRLLKAYLADLDAELEK